MAKTTPRTTVQGSATPLVLKSSATQYVRTIAVCFHALELSCHFLQVTMKLIECADGKAEDK